MSFNFSSLEVGDIVRVTCPDRSCFEGQAEYKITGRVKSIFNALDNDGDSWHIEIANHNQWFMYKPKLDGGELIVIEKGN